MAPSGKPVGFVRQSGTSSIAALLAMLSGLLLDVALALRFGAGRQSDAFFAAARIPVGLAALLMTIAVQAWVPLFTRDLGANGSGSLSRFASRMVTAVLTVGAGLWAIASLTARPLISATAPGLSGGQIELAASMVSPMFLIVPLVAAAEVVRAALNASHSFVLPAGMNVAMNGFAATMILLEHGRDIRYVAWAYVTGAAFQLLVIGAVAWIHGIHLLPAWNVTDPRIRSAFRLSARPTVSSVLNLLNRTAEQAIASFLPTGSITVLSYGQRLISALGGGVFFRPITAALIPRLAGAEHDGHDDARNALVRRALTMVLGVSLALTAFTVALAQPAVRLVFHRGNFGPNATHLLALTLAIYGGSLVGSGVQRVLLAPFYARMDTRTPLRNTAYGVIVDLVLIFPCVALFGLHSTAGVLGVALAYVLDQYVIVAHAWYRLRSTVTVRASELAGPAMWLLIAAAAGAGVMLTMVHVFGVGTIGSRLDLFAVTAGTATAGAVVMGLIGGVTLGPRRRAVGVHRRTTGRR